MDIASFITIHIFLKVHDVEFYRILKLCYSTVQSLPHPVDWICAWRSFWPYTLTTYVLTNHQFVSINTLVATCTVLSHKELDESSTGTSLLHTNFFATNWKAFVSLFGACRPEVIQALLCTMCTKYCHNNLSHFSPSINNFIFADIDLPHIEQTYQFANRDQRVKLMNNLSETQKRHSAWANYIIL